MPHAWPKLRQFNCFLRKEDQDISLKKNYETAFDPD